MLGDEIHIVHHDPEPLLDEKHELEQAQRVQDACFQQRRRVRERQQGRVLDEFPADVVVDDGFQLSDLQCALRLPDVHYLPCPASQARSILPVEVLGSASQNSTTSGTM